ncbi:oxidoreductase, partial [Mycobacterium sp. ITM-2017-0098]
ASGRLRHDPTLGLADAALAGLFAASAAVRRIRPPGGGPDTFPLTVAARRVVARDQDVVELTLTPSANAALPRWHPGAHLDIHLPSGLVRQYSLCGDPSVAGH